MLYKLYKTGDESHVYKICLRLYNRGQNLLRKFIKHVYSTLTSANNESKPSATTPLPHTMLLLAGTFHSTLNGGGGGLEVYTNNRFARNSPVFNNFLNTFVPDCRCIGHMCCTKENGHDLWMIFACLSAGESSVAAQNKLMNKTDVIHEKPF